MRGQAERFGAELRAEDVERVSLTGEIKTVVANGVTYRARAVILAMGAAARYLGVPGEQELLGRGVSSCATCDGFFFRDQDIAVIGGGDSAMEEATFLTRFASSVTVVHRRDEFRASKIMLERAAQRREDPLGDQRARSSRCSASGRVVRAAAARHPHRRGVHARGDRHVRGDRSRPAQRAGRAASSTSTRPATSWSRRRAPAPRSPACSPAATWSTTPTGRPSPRPARAVPRRSTPSAGSPRRPIEAELAGGGYGPAAEQVAAVTG